MYNVAETTKKCTLSAATTQIPIWTVAGITSHMCTVFEPIRLRTLAGTTKRYSLLLDYPYKYTVVEVTKHCTLLLRLPGYLHCVLDGRTMYTTTLRLY
jgi:hypothetical protein